MKLYYKLLFLFILFVSFNSYATQKPLELIFQNRHHILSNLNHLNDGSSLSDSISVPFRYLSTMMIYKLLDSTFSYWKKNEAIIISEFMGTYIPKANMFYKYSFYIQDSITISTLISLLDYPDYRPKPILRDTSSVATWEYLSKIQSPEPNWVRDAVWVLCYKTYFSSLSKHSDAILEHLNQCKEPVSDKLKLLVLCRPPDSILKIKRDSITNAKNHLGSLFKVMQKDTNVSKIQDSVRLVVTELRNIESIPLWVMARLGDTVAEKEIVKGLVRKDDNVYRVLDYATAASFVWSDSCKMAYMKLFDRDIPRCPTDVEYKICRSMQDTLLVLLARHHPSEEIFSNLLSYNRINADFCKPEKQNPYFTKFAEWTKKHYNIDISYKGFIPYFSKDFSKDKSAIRNLCK